MSVDDLFVGANGACCSGQRAGGDVSEASYDLELKKRNGRPSRCACCTRWPMAATGSRRFAYCHHRPERGGEAADGDSQRAADVRFARFFNATPMAIASVASDGRVTRHNPAYARMMVAARGGAGQSVLDAVVEREREALRAAVETAAGGAVDIAPLDLTLAGDGSRTARFFLTAVDSANSAQGEAAVVYALETTEQRTLEQKLRRRRRCRRSASLPAASPTTSTMCCRRYRLSGTAAGQSPRHRPSFRTSCRSSRTPTGQRGWCGSCLPSPAADPAAAGHRAGRCAGRSPDHAEAAAGRARRT